VITQKERVTSLYVVIAQDDQKSQGFSPAAGRCLLSD